MNNVQFASLVGASAFNRVVVKRQKLVAARAKLEAVMDADPCHGRCKCALRPAYDAAVKDEVEASSARVSAEDSWRSYCEIRHS